MSAANSEVPKTGEISSPVQAHFPPNVLSVSVNAETLNVHPSALAALEKLAQHNPELANKIMDATTHAISKETSARNIAVISTSAVLAVTIGVTALIIIFNGLASGIVFFLCLVAIAAICGAIFAKKAVDLSWTASILGGSAKPDTPERE